MHARMRTRGRTHIQVRALRGELAKLGGKAETDARAFQSQVEQLDRMLEEARAERDSIKGTLNAVRDERDQLRTQVASITQEVAASRVRHADSDAAIAAAERRVEAAERARDSSERQLKEEGRRADEAEARTARVREELEAAVAAKAAAKVALEETSLKLEYEPEAARLRVEMREMQAAHRSELDPNLHPMPCRDVT